MMEIWFVHKPSTILRWYLGYDRIGMCTSQVNILRIRAISNRPQTMLCHGFAYRAWEPWALRARAQTISTWLLRPRDPKAVRKEGTEIGITVSELRRGRDRVRSWKQLLTKLFQDLTQSRPWRNSEIIRSRFRYPPSGRFRVPRP